MRSADGSAERLAETLASWPTWHDVSGHEGERVPFFKRAQIAAADLHVVGIAPASDLGRLTLFADNLVPHVLRLDSARSSSTPRLVARIDEGLLLEHGSPEEVEIRACALHAVEWPVVALWGHDGDGGRQRAVEPWGAASLQGAAAASGSDDGLFQASVRGGRRRTSRAAG